MLVLKIVYPVQVISPFHLSPGFDHWQFPSKKDQDDSTILSAQCKIDKIAHHLPH